MAREPHTRHLYVPNSLIEELEVAFNMETANASQVIITAAKKGLEAIRRERRLVAAFDDLSLHRDCMRKALSDDSE